jgi:hypothetical protein
MQQIDWIKIEREYSELHNGNISKEFIPDCVPSNAREWHRFAEQWDHIMSLPDDFDPSFDGMSYQDVDHLADEHLCLGHGFKKSVYECFRDLGKNDRQIFERNGVVLDPLDNGKVEIFGFFDRMKAVTLWDGHKIPRLPKHVAGNCRFESARLSALPFIETCGGNYNCSENHLVSLKGAPRKVGGFFDCSNNPIKTFEGGPAEVVRTFKADHVSVKDLTGAPSKVGFLQMNFCGFLESLAGSDMTVQGKFMVTNCRISTTKGMPIVEGAGDINLSKNPLWDLDGLQETVNGNLNISDTVVRDFGPVKHIKGDLIALRCGIDKDSDMPTVDGKKHIDAYLAKNESSIMSYEDFKRRL